MMIGVLSFFCVLWCYTSVVEIRVERFNFTFIDTSGFGNEYQLLNTIWGSVYGESGYPGPRSGCYHDGDDETLYLYGGQINGLYLCDLWILNTTSNTWKSLIVSQNQTLGGCGSNVNPLYPGAGGHGASAFWNGYFYITQGVRKDFTGQNKKMSDIYRTNSSGFWEYVSVDPEWGENDYYAYYSEDKSRIGGRWGYSYALNGSHLVIYAGRGLTITASTQLNDIWSIDFANVERGWFNYTAFEGPEHEYDEGCYYPTPTRPSSRFYHMSWIFGDYFYVYSGIGIGEYLSDMWKFHLFSHHWSYIELRVSKETEDPKLFDGRFVTPKPCPSYVRNVHPFITDDSLFIIFERFDKPRIWRFYYEEERFYLLGTVGDSLSETDHSIHSSFQNSESYNHPSTRSHYVSFVKRVKTDSPPRIELYLFGGYGVGLNGTDEAQLGDLWVVENLRFFTSPNCFDNNFTEDSACSYHGECIGHDQCLCDEINNFFGPNCTNFGCFNVSELDVEEVCSGEGKCISPDLCLCNSSIEYHPYFGLNCQVTLCGGYWSNDTSEVCSGVGECLLNQTCSCQEGYIGSDCEIHSCYGFPYSSHASDPVCGGHGTCENLDNCSCVSNYTIEKDCTVWECSSILNNDTTNRVCSGHGTCVSYNNCSCESVEYGGNNCEFWSCYSVSVSSVDTVCGGHGFCFSSDKCFCQNGYNSEFVDGPCTVWKCGKLLMNEDGVCSGRGVCVGASDCECEGEYEGEKCETYSCGFDYRWTQTCSGNGKCVSPGRCECDVGYSGKFCETNTLYLTVMTPVLSFVGVLVIFSMVSICVCFCNIILICLILLMVILCICVGITGVNRLQKKRLVKFGRLKDVDLLLKEQEMDDDESIAHLRMKKELYTIDFNNIKVEGMIGEGGSHSIVFRAFWSNKIVAFKCFKTRHVCSDQSSYEEFEREVEIIASVSHPHIVRFFGATLKPPRVGIVMEFCSNGDLEQFTKRFQEKYRMKYPLKEKIRLLFEISSSFSYLHERNIIHRDLKMENILVDSLFSAKLMDFGLSKIVERMSVQKTKKIGTNVYMAPELVIGRGDYDTKCDVYSFSILCWILITENHKPYGENIHNVELRVANDPKFRPKIELLKVVIEEEEKSQELFENIRQLIESCWSYEKEERMSFTEISKLFLSNLISNNEKLEEEEKFKRLQVIEHSKGLKNNEDEKMKRVETISYENLERRVQRYKLKLKEIIDLKTIPQESFEEIVREIENNEEKCV